MKGQVNMWRVLIAGFLLALGYRRAAQRDEKNGLPFTAAMEWRKAADALLVLTLLAAHPEGKGYVLAYSAGFDCNPDLDQRVDWLQQPYPTKRLNGTVPGMFALSRFPNSLLTGTQSV
jgi:hypothetical protein